MLMLQTSQNTPRGAWQHEATSTAPNFNGGDTQEKLRLSGLTTSLFPSVPSRKHSGQLLARTHRSERHVLYWGGWALLGSTGLELGNPP